METQIDISKLTAEQLKQIQAQFKAEKAKLASGREARYAVIDAMIIAPDCTFKWTTADILEELQRKELVPATLAKDDRAEWLKKIQTRKQYLEKLTNEDGTLVHAKGTVGYKPSAGGFTRALTSDTVVDWLMDDAHVALLTPADRKAILKALKD